MAKWTETEAQQFYDAAKDAYLKAMNSEKYEIAGRSKQNQKIESLKKEMEYWSGILDDIKTGRTPGSMKVARGIAYV